MATIAVGVSLFRTREEILADMIASLQTYIPDAFIEEDSVLWIILNVVAGVIESVFLALDIMARDMFVQSASEAALARKGDEYAIPRQAGTRASGTVVFSGDGGTVINVGTEVAYDPGTGDDMLYFNTTGIETIPNHGVPLAPTAVLNVAAGNLTGTYEYVVTFVTAGGETLPGAESVGVVTSSEKVDLSAISLGGPGTTKRRIYRQKNGSGVYNRVVEIADNTTTTYTDNIADGSVGGNPPLSSTAESVVTAAESDDVGAIYNVGPGSITVLTNAPDGVTGVTNTASFTGGTDLELTGDYRQRLLEALRDPQTGSPGDLQTWAEEVDGVERATVIENDNLGTPTAGHATVRISGPGGSVPDSTVQANVLAALVSKDIANVALHVGVFTPVTVNVGITATPATGYVLADITNSIQLAVADYINTLEVAETVTLAGIISAAYTLPGVADIVVTSPGANVAITGIQKAVAGTVTVS
jgi:uncharacterized phage protein gp47/JayE